MQSAADKAFQRNVMNFNSFAAIGDFSRHRGDCHRRL